MAGLIHVVLVHGTWPDGMLAASGDFLRRALRLSARSRQAQGSRYWYQDDHAFGRELCARLQADGLRVERHEPLLWSGANSFRARFDAAADLTSRLEALAGRTLIVGHSHGGSVALQSVARLTSERARDIEVVTLSTPFVRAVACASPALAGAVTAIGMAAIVGDAALRGRAAGVGIGDLIALERFVTARLLLMVLLVLSVVGLAVFVSNWFEQGVARPLATRFKGRRLHCIRGISDEAGLAIAGGLLGAGISRLLIGVIGLVTRHWLPATALLVAAGALLAAVFGAWNAPELVTLGSRVLAVSAWGVLAAWLLACAGNWFLGAEFARVGLLYIGGLDSTPDASPGTLEVETLADAHGTLDGLRHSALYLRPDIATIVVAGVTRHTPP
jgi:hypothetical protein